jgi:hypothetical protein
MTFPVSCVKLVTTKSKKETQVTMYILSFLQQFLKTNLNYFYKSKRGDVRNHYNIPATDILWFNGFDYKTIIFINNDLCFESCEIPIQRMIWIKSSGERTHIYLRPSFVIKHCPFPICTLEYIWNVCITCETDPFDMVQDPERLLDSSMSLEYYTRKVFKIIGYSEYMFKWKRLHDKVFYSLSPEAEKTLIEPGLLPAIRTYGLIQLLAERLHLKVPQYGYLSFANFQIPLN